MAVHKARKLLQRLFLEHLPPVPALNKWLACYPMLSWLLLGSLLHNVMPRAWLTGVLNKPGIILPEDLDPEAAPAQPVAPEAAPAQPAEQPADRVQDPETLFRKKRSKRAARVHRWMNSPLSQLWSLVAMVVTTPLGCMIKDYLQDEYMYHPEAHFHDAAAVRPWLPMPRGANDRPMPTVMSFMKGNQASLRKAQSSVAATLSMDMFSFFRSTFPLQPTELIADAVQTLGLETLGDMYLRFTCEYRAAPFSLVLLVQEGVPEARRRAVANAFHDLPRCCCKPHFETKLKQLFPTVDLLLSAACVAIIAAWADHTFLVTKSVEFMHKCNSLVAKSKGHAKPSLFNIVADGFVVNRLQVFHGNALGKRAQRQRSLKIRRHPKLMRVIKKVKSLNKTSRNGVGGNPKLHFINAERARLKSLGLTNDDFRNAVKAAVRGYDENFELQRVHKLDWERHQWRKSIDRINNIAQAQRPQEAAPPKRLGPWGLGDEFWPFAEDAFAATLAAGSKMGGVRFLAEEHRAWQNDNLIFGDGEGDYKPAPIHKTCAEAHPGFKPYLLTYLLTYLLS